MLLSRGLLLAVAAGCVSFGVSFSGILVQKPLINSLVLQKKIKSSSTDYMDSLASDPNEGMSFSPVFDFSNPQAISSFERIDDAIMGGISTSAVREVPEQDYASWSGVCRLDGGGFCGMRTLPFKEPLSTEHSDGIYIVCRLVSDNEPERRVWKVTTRIEASRGETVYQAQFKLPKQRISEEWLTVKVPFEDFKLVQGPRMVPGGAPMNATGGLYQLGMTMSKFAMGFETTELPNFRPGFFNLQIKSIGFFEMAAEGKTKSVQMPEILSKDEVQKRRPLTLKLLFPLFKLLFSEKRNRRKSALKILTEKRGLSRVGATKYGLKYKAQTANIVKASVQTVAMLSLDAFRVVFGLLLRLLIFTPLRLVRTVTGLFSKQSASEGNEKTQTAS